MSQVRVRYIVQDVEEAIAFYTRVLDFTVDFHPAPGFAALSRGPLRLLINQPGAGGAGTQTGEIAPAPGGWNRFQMEVDDLAATVERLKAEGCVFRSGIVKGNGGDQILLEDPSGNPVELFQPAQRS
ncbi:VOC family protein [Chelativorans alearense]|uniref:VOC family protein n=1 Tax=Chelativorans alearense TaxID=2681495 RepID=UPI0013D78A42|nr:VOC family protein [Chelativorans alearense]